MCLSQTNLTTSDVKPAGYTNDTEIGLLVDIARSQYNLKVVLKIMVFSNTVGELFYLINPTDPLTWFTRYNGKVYKMCTRKISN